MKAVVKEIRAVYFPNPDRYYVYAYLENGAQMLLSVEPKQDDCGMFQWCINVINKHLQLLGKELDCRAEAATIH